MNFLLLNFYQFIKYSTSGHSYIYKYYFSIYLTTTFSTMYDICVYLDKCINIDIDSSKIVA